MSYEDGIRAAIAYIEVVLLLSHAASGSIGQVSFSCPRLIYIIGRQVILISFPRGQQHDVNTAASQSQATDALF